MPRLAPGARQQAWNASAMNVCSDNGYTPRRAGWTVGAVLAALMLPICGLTWAVQAQPVDAVCLEDPSAGCLAGAAALEFPGIDDAEIWRFDIFRRPNLARILVETGRDKDLAVFLDKAAGVAPPPMKTQSSLPLRPSPGQESCLRHAR